MVKDLLLLTLHVLLARTSSSTTSCTTYEHNAKVFFLSMNSFFIVIPNDDIDVSNTLQIVQNLPVKHVSFLDVLQRIDSQPHDSLFPSARNVSAWLDCIGKTDNPTNTFLAMNGEDYRTAATRPDERINKNISLQRILELRQSL